METLRALNFTAVKGAKLLWMRFMMCLRTKAMVQCISSMISVAVKPDTDDEEAPVEFKEECKIGATTSEHYTIYLERAR